MITYSLGPTSATEVDIIPDWDYTAGEDMNRSTMRTKTGKLFTYKWNDVKKIKFGVDLFNGSDASIVNSWWDSQAKLIFFVDDDGTTDCTSVMIMNKSAPFRSHPEPYQNRFKGAIQLEEYL